MRHFGLYAFAVSFLYLLLGLVAGNADAQPATAPQAAPVAQPAPSAAAAPPTPLAQPAPLAAPATAAACKSNALVDQLVQQALTDTQAGQATSAWLSQDFRDAHDAIRCHKQSGKLPLDRLIGLEGQLAKIETSLSPASYTLTVLKDDECFNKNNRGAECQTRLAGFARAAWTFSNEYTCGATMARFNKTKVAEFRVGFADWWKTHMDQNDKCEPPPKPTRCIVGWCWGGDDQYKHGVSLRTALELGGTLGKGLGFSDQNGGATFQFTGSVGTRLFFFHDTFDLHASFGIATSTSSSTTGSGSSGAQSRGFLVLSPGVGFWHGLFSVNYIHTFDPFGSQGSGNGLGVFADTVAIERVVQQATQK